MQNQEEVEFYSGVRKSEKAFIGAILLNNELMNYAVEHVRPNSFIIGKNRPIFSAMVELNRNHREISPATIISELHDHGMKVDQDDEQYILSLSDDVPRALTKERDDYFMRFGLITISMSISEELFSDKQLPDIGRAVAEKFRHLKQLGFNSSVVNELQSAYSKALS